MKKDKGHFKIKKEEKKEKKEKEKEEKIENIEKDLLKEESMDLGEL